MKNVVLTRIDDRLIHGQVISGWVPYVRANQIIIVDDEIAKNKLMTRILSASLDESIKLKICSTKKAIKVLQEEPASSKERILLLTKSPIPILDLVNSGCSIDSVNLGGIGMHDDRQPYFRNISCSKEEEEALHLLKDKEVKIFYQLVPEQAKIDSSSFM